MKAPAASAGVKVALLADPLLGDLVALVLRHVDAECRPVSGKSDVERLVTEWRPDILIADLDRHEHAPEWTRLDGTVVPCLGLMRRRDTLTKFTAFDRGADDIIEVPFTPDEIVVRTIAALRRASGRRVEMRPSVPVGPFEMDLLGPGVRFNGTNVHLTLLEQTLLYVFLAHPGETLDRESILANIWGSESAVTSNVIDRHIRDLRVKLREQWKTPTLIATVPGEGYRYLGGASETPPAG